MKQHSSDLDPSRNVVDDADGLGVRVARQAVGDDVELHLPGRLGAGFLTVNGFACWTLKTAILDGRTYSFNGMIIITLFDDIDKHCFVSYFIIIHHKKKLHLKCHADSLGCI